MASHYAVESCKETLAKSGLSPEAESSICEQAMMLPSVHRICASQPKIGMPYQLIICYNKSTGEQKWWPDNIFENCAKLNKADPNWELEAAFCCCYVFDATSQQAIARGTLNGTATDPSLNWTPTKLDFAQALDDPGQTGVLVHTDSAPGEVILAPAQPIVTADGKFVQAEHVTPGDRLMSDSGKPVTVTAVGAGPTGAVPPALSFVGDHSPHARLYSQNGLMVGDFGVQSGFHGLSSEMKADPSARRSATATKKVRYGDGSTFELRGNFGPHPGPSDTVSYMFTEAQADDILAKGDLLPTGNPVVEDRVDKAISLLRGFYPDVSIAYKDTSMVANIEAHHKTLRKGLSLTLHGGLARQKSLQEEGLLMALCHGMAAFGLDPSTPEKAINCVATADFDAYGVYARNIWSQSTFLSNSQAAMKQWSALFDLVTPKNAAGDPEDPCGDPSLKCRTESVQAGFVGGNQPSCGKPVSYLKLVELTVEQAALLSLTFSEDLDAKTAGTASNYSLSPDISVVSAGVATSNPKEVLLTLNQKLDENTNYTLDLSNLTSVSGDKLYPDPTITTFSYSPYGG